MTVVYGNGDEALRMPAAYCHSIFALSAEVEDFDGDGVDTWPCAQQPVRIELGKGDGSSYTAYASMAPRGRWIGAAGDFNGDGAVDLVGPNNVGSVAVSDRKRGDHDVADLPPRGWFHQISAPSSVTAYGRRCHDRLARRNM